MLELRCHSLNPPSPDSSGVPLPNKQLLLYNYALIITLHSFENVIFTILENCFEVRNPG